MANAPDLQGIRPVPPREDEEEGAPAVRRPVRQGAVSQYVRPRHEPMNCYPTADTKADFENRVEELASKFRRAHGRKIPNGVIHEVALSMVLENWDTVVAQVMG